MKLTYRVELEEFTEDGQRKARMPRGSFSIPTIEPLDRAEGEAPPIQGSISDSNWSRAALKDFDTKMSAALANLAQDARRTQSDEFGQYVDFVRESKKAAVIVPALERIERHVSEALAEHEGAADFARQVEQAAMTVAEPKDPIAALRQDNRASEVRQAIAALPAKERMGALNDIIREGDLFKLDALVDAPLPLFDSNGQLVIDRARRELAGQRFPWLPQMVEQRAHVAHAAAVRAAEYQREVRRILTRHGLDYDRIQQYRVNIAKQAKQAKQTA